jgi:putative intracellular protease/amidase
MRRNVAILLFNEVEVLDFAGPFEVFAVTDELADSKLFNVHTVADVPGTIRTRNGLLVIPEHTFESAPAPDIIIVPGGVGTRAFLKKPSVIDWIRRRSRSAQVTASVCTGALVLAQAGLPRRARGHHALRKSRRPRAPRAKSAGVGRPPVSRSRVGGHRGGDFRRDRPVASSRGAARRSGNGEQNRPLHGIPLAQRPRRGPLTSSMAGPRTTLPRETET